MSNNTPLVSVIMGIYNCADTLPSALDSILNQTFQNFEIILCDDGSTDETLTVAQKYADLYKKHIVLVKNEKNMGLNYTLNRCLKLTQGKYIARMDGDDESLPERLQIEQAYLTQHSECAFVSSNLEVFDDNGVWGRTNFKADPQPADLIIGSTFSHSACMIRKSVFNEVGGYSVDKKLIRVEDKHLWYKIYAAGYVGHNLSDVLYLYRDDRVGYNKRKFRYRLNSVYVDLLTIRRFKLPFYYFFVALKTIIVGLLPYPIYNILHRWKMRQAAKIKL